MWYFRKPSDRFLHAFLERQQALPFSYPEVGASRGAFPPGYDHDRNRIQLGKGQDVFAAARAALRGWRMFPPSWTWIFPPGSPIREGQVVGMLARLFGLWWLNACRIVYTFEDSRRFGFAYGTLPRHVERGEECFSVEWLEDDSVWYDLRAFSRPRYWMVRLGYPLARRCQRRFVRDSQAAMVRAAGDLLVGREE